MLTRTAITTFLAALWFSCTAFASTEIGVMDSSENPITLSYVPQENSDANSCEMWVNGFGDGTEHVYAAVGGQLYETWIQLNASYLEAHKLQVLNAGVFLRYTEQTTQRPNPEIRQTLVTAAPYGNDPYYLRADFRYRWHNFEKETSRVVHGLAIFLDVEGPDAVITRYWMSNNSQNFSVSDILNGYPLTPLITVGPGLRTMRYLESWSDSPIFAQRRRCSAERRK